MKWYCYDGANWQLINVMDEHVKEIPNKIDGTTTIVLVVRSPQYSLLNAGWDETFLESAGAFKRVVCVTDDHDGDDLDAEIDDCNKLWYGRITSIEHDENYCYLGCESIETRWLKRRVEHEDNVVEEKTITTVTDGNTLTFPAATFDIDEHKNRGCRIIAREPLEQTCYASDVDVYNGETPADNCESEDETVGNIDDEDTDGTNKVYGQNIDVATKVEADTYIDLTFPVTRSPTGRYKLTIWCAMGSAAALATGVIRIMHANGTDSTDLWEGITSTGTLGTPFEFTINDEAMQYYDATNEQIVIQLFADGFQPGGPTWNGGVHVYYARLDWSLGYQHAPVEFQVTGGTATTLDLSVNAGVTDLLTEHVNDGDTVQVLEKDSTFVETYLDDYCSDYLDVAATPASTKPTFSDKNFPTVQQDFADACSRNKWYWYPTRATTAGKAIITTAERATPTSHGLLVTPGNIDYTKGGIRVRYNGADKIGGVIIRNKDGYAGYSSAGAYPANALPTNDLDIIVLTRNDIPTVYLGTIAQALYTQRTSILASLELCVRSIERSSEDFESYDEDHRVRAETNPFGMIWDAWATAAGCDFTAVTHLGRKRGRYRDTDAATSIEPYLTFSTGKTFAATTDWFEFTIIRIAGGGTAVPVLSLRRGATRLVRVYISDTAITTLSNATVTNVATGLTAGVEWRVRFTYASNTTVTIAVWQSGVLFANDVFDTNALAEWDDGAVTRFYITGGIANTSDQYISDIRCSWLGDGTFDVQDAPDDAFHAGAAIRVKGAETTKGSTTWLVNAERVIRELYWVNDKTARLVLGFSDAEKKTIDEAFNEILDRHAMELANT